MIKAGVEDAKKQLSLLRNNLDSRRVGSRKKLHFLRLWMVPDKLSSKHEELIFSVSIQDHQLSSEVEKK